ncbi:MAG: hypothetical protein L0Z62_01175 [Gemmataceae bacterium]|nr:hypothetical protein [Gemmataceae bacterium]
MPPSRARVEAVGSPLSGRRLLLAALLAGSAAWACASGPPEIREQRAVHQQALIRRTQAQDQVVAQVVQARELVGGTRERLAVTRAALFDDRGEPAGPVFLSLRLNFLRIRNEPQARALEVLDSIRGLNDMLEAYGQALTDRERAHFRLLLALGVPLPGLFGPAPAPPLNH